MPPQKRKRLHDDIADSTAHPAKPQPPQEPARRVTRQNPKGLLNEEKHHLRSGRVRANTSDKTTGANPAPERARVKKHDAPKTVTTAAPPAAEVPAKQTSHSKTASASTGSSKENIQPSTQAPTGAVAATSTKQPLKTVLPSHTASSPPGKLPKPPKPPRAQARGPSSKPTPQKQQSIPSSSSLPAATATALATPKRTLGEKPLKPPPTPRSDRNIDKVVLGDICFKAWYPSYYGKEVLGDVTGNAGGGGGGGKDIGARMGGGGKRDPPMLDRLYVCPCCFKYSKELVSWWEHVRCCEQKGLVPGRKVYTHPKGTGVRKVKTTTAADPAPGGGGRGKGKKKVDVEPPPPTVEEKIEEGEWSVWEVDGEDERLFCQNLSLFAKLFLDNKSVFFDVSGFNYFLLVYTPPPSPHSSTSSSSPSQPGPPPLSTSATSDPNKTNITPPPALSLPRPRPQIVGFFSKEKMSWDNNNLACILVFPPWQRKGLGSILMGVSYEISRREGILGGPEKPISDLGRKGYKRFWAGEIARWLLSEEVLPSSSSSVASAGGHEEGGEEVNQESEREEQEKEQEQEEAEDIAETTGNGSGVVVDIQKCSRATWIVPEDCLLVLREMGVVEEATPGPASGDAAAAAAVAASTIPTSAPAGTAAADGTTGDSTPASAIAEEGGPAAAVAAVAAAKEVTTKKLVPRVRVDKAAVRRWVAANKIELERTCDPDGFLEGYAVKNKDSKKIKIHMKTGIDADTAAPADGADVVG